MTNFTFKKWNLILGWISFSIALITYSLTVEPTMSFWDCGEYIATAAKLEIGHPPGAPLFQLTGAFFAMFATGPDKIALMVNMVSVFSGAFAILFMYWSMTLLLKNIVSSFSSLNQSNSIMILGASLIGCLALTFSDSFWFNATEAEVYAMASLFISLLMWAGLRWGEEMHTQRGNKWLLLISLLVGLSFGVHFMALLTIPSLGLIYYFKNYKTITVKNFVIANIIVVGALLFVFKFLLPYTLALFAKTEIFMVNTFRLPFNSGTLFMFILIAGLFYFALNYTKRKGMPLYNTAILCLLFVFTGFTTWMTLPIRSNANVVINENKPSDAAEVLAYYNRDHYGEQKTFYGHMYTEAYSGLDKSNPFKDGKPNHERDYKSGKYVIVNNYKNAVHNTDEKHNGVLPRMHNEKSAASYMDYAGAPKFRINPNYDYTSELEQYGIDTTSITEEEALHTIAQIRGELENIVADFKAAYRSGQLDNEDYDKFLKSYKQYIIVDKPSFAQNMKFMFEYQFGYMYWRYLMWNFAGRQDDVQGHNNFLHGNWISGFDFIDEARLGNQDSLTQDMLNNKGRNIYYFIPFVLGIIGLIFHARKDPKSFYTFLVLFVFMSIALKVFVNEKPFEPRERDYVLVGSFYVFAIWIGLGVYAIYNAIIKYINPKIATPVVLAATLLAAPLLMAKENWDDHDRSGRRTAPAMAKAYLDSCDPNAILFTYADNDTFPLYYAQEVEGFRTDVRVVCTALLASDWHIDQMKRKAHLSDSLPITLEHHKYAADNRDFIIYVPQTEERIDISTFVDFITSDDERAKVELTNGHMANYYPTNKIRIPVDREAVIRNKVVSPELYNQIVPYIDIDLPKEAIYKNTLAMLDILKNNNWERPIYFSGTTLEEDHYLWMKDYLQLDGMTYKLVPVKTPVRKDNPIALGHIDSKKMYDTVMRWDWGNGSSPKIYHDPETRNNSITFRKNLARLTEKLINEGQTAKAEKIIDLAVKEMPLQHFGFYYMSEPFAEGYYKIGKKEKARKLLSVIIEKYQDELRFFNSVDILGNIEGYQELLAMVKENNDLEFYNRHIKDFNLYAKMAGLKDPENS